MHDLGDRHGVNLGTVGDRSLTHRVCRLTGRCLRCFQHQPARQRQIESIELSLDRAPPVLRRPPALDAPLTPGAAGVIPHVLPSYAPWTVLLAALRSLCRSGGRSREGFPRGEPLASVHVSTLTFNCARTALCAAPEQPLHERSR